MQAVTWSVLGHGRADYADVPARPQIIRPRSAEPCFAGNQRETFPRRRGQDPLSILLPYLEHVRLRQRAARQIASSIFNKAPKGPGEVLLNLRRYKVNFDVGPSQAARAWL